MHKIWHQGDFEHDSIKVDPATEEPVEVYFYLHEGGTTVRASDCYWSQSNTPTYSGIQKGYDNSATHLHIWLAANSHASYNRYEAVQRVDATSPLSGLCSFLGNLVDEHYQDNVDYDPSGHDLYFEYDYLEKLGEIKSTVNAHGVEWLVHFEATPSSKIWLPFIGRFGYHWASTCNVANTQHHFSPQSPAHGGISHEYYDFTISYVQGFGNTVELSWAAELFVDVFNSWNWDLPDGD